MHQQEIKRKIDKLRSYLEELKPFLISDTAVLLQDKIKVRAIERLFQLIVDEAVDINMLLITDSQAENPENYRSTFYALVNLKVLDNNLAGRISESAKLRNQLVHKYEEVQEKEMIEKIKKFTEMYEEYLVYVIKAVVK